MDVLVYIFWRFSLLLLSLAGNARFILMVLPLAFIRLLAHLFDAFCGALDFALYRH